MQIEFSEIIWLLGGILVLLSWFRKVPVWLGWLGFLTPMAVYTFNTGITTQLEWIYLWIAGALLVVVSWLPKVHHAFGWTGLYITLTAAGLEWIAHQARVYWAEPFVVITPEMDLLIYSFLGYSLTNEWYLRFIKRDPVLRQQVDYINYLHSMFIYWQKHPANEAYKKRAHIFWIRSFKEFVRLWEMMGSMLARAVLLSVLGFLLFTANYYNTQTEFNFILFSCNWFYAWCIYLFVVGLPLYFIQERFHDLRIMVSERE